MRGYFGIGIFHTKNSANIGTLWRSASLFGAQFIFTIGRRYRHQSSDTVKTPRHIPLHEFERFEDFLSFMPWSCPLVGIEQVPGKSRDLENFVHPERAIYLLGAEDHGLPPDVIERCHHLIEIDTPRCLNVSVAGSIVMYARQTQRAARAMRSA